MRDSRLFPRMLAALALFALATAPIAFGHAGHTGSAGTGTGNTLDNTIRPSGPDFGALETRAGEPHRVLTRLGRAAARRAATRRSLLYFAQLTDPQIVDEMSPARVEFLDPVGSPVESAWRPQEAFGPWVWDRAVRAANRNRTSRVRQAGGARRRMDMAVLTGDLIDNQQLNEVRWYVDILNGGRIDPMSGKPLGGDNQCPQATPPQAARMNDDVANRRYTGVQDFSDYPGVPGSRYQQYWDPNVRHESGPYAHYPRYPGLMDRAQQPFDAQGLRVPWYTARGNHDGLVQGNAPANDFFQSIAVGCLKVFPGASLDPASFVGQDFQDVFAQLSDPAFLQQLLGSGLLTPPDPERRFIGRPEFKALHGSQNRNAGFGYVDRGELNASDGAASYYAFTPRRGLRMISIDTVAEGGESNGNVDDPQYRWLERELDRNSSTELRANGTLARDRDPDRLIVLYGHHTLQSMNNPVQDEAAPPCAGVRQPGCDEDPRSSTPIHRGTSGDRTIRDLLLRYPNVIAYVSGHTHRNAIDPFKHPRHGSGFWQINTASLTDPPQQLRTIEVMDNRDGTLSLFNTVVDHSAPTAVPPEGTSTFSDSQLASIARAAAFVDPQRDVDRDLGELDDRNVELLLRDPRLLARAAPPARRGTRGAPRSPRDPSLTGREIAP